MHFIDTEHVGNISMHYVENRQDEDRLPNNKTKNHHDDI